MTDKIAALGVHIDLSMDPEHEHRNASTMAEALIDIGRIVYSSSPQPVCLNCLLQELAIQYATLAAILPKSLASGKKYEPGDAELQRIVTGVQNIIASARGPVN